MRDIRRLCLENECTTQSVSCNNNSDCTVLNTENNNFICTSNICELDTPVINFGETKLIDMMYKKRYKYEFSIPAPEMGRGSFNINLNGLEYLSDFLIYLNVDLYNSETDYTDWYNRKDYFMNKDSIELKVYPFTDITRINVELTITFNNYLGDTPPTLSLEVSENNTDGCQDNNNCEDISGYYRICNLETHSCIKTSIEEIIASSLEGENCFYDEDCIGDDLACERGICTKTCDGYPPCGENQYCSNLDETYSNHFCLEKCYSDLDCKTYEANFYARCNLENNECY
jgi:hypothetical protein